MDLTDTTLIDRRALPATQTKATAGKAVSFGPLVSVRKLGQGSAGEVFEARDPVTDRRYAVKRLWPEARTASDLARFAREAELMSKLQHPNLMQVVRVDNASRPPYYVMPLLRGSSLREILKTSGGLAGRIGIATAIARDACLGLAEAHRLGIIHRDVKPGNLFVDDTGRTVILDFGLAKATFAADAALTAVGTILGTPAYMAPEQCRGEIVTTRADVYSLGVVVLEMILGRNPFASTGLAKTIRLHLEATPRRLDAVLPGKVGTELGELVHRMIAKEPRQRPKAESCFEVFAGLARHQEMVALAQVAARIDATTTAE